MAEIALGTLALKKASHKDVKEFGAEIREDHQYASQEVKELSASEGIIFLLSPTQSIKNNSSDCPICPEKHSTKHLLPYTEESSKGPTGV